MSVPARPAAFNMGISGIWLISVAGLRWVVLRFDSGEATSWRRM